MSNSTDTHKEQPRPLEGIRIVEYGIFHAGPGGNAILGDLGAEVIKIETSAGDPERYWTQVAGFDFSLKNGESLIFEASNRNKKGICLDIKKEKGRKIFDRLITHADVFLTNLRKSTKTRLGLDYKTLSRLNPNIIFASVSGYGLEGPMSDHGAFDPLGQARSGMMFVGGNSEPEMLHLGILDQATAITVSHAILTALLVRERRGIGQEVHISLYSTSLWIQYMNLLINTVLSIDPCIPADRTRHSPLRNRFRCQDGKWVLATHHPEEKYWAAFCTATGQRKLLDDSRFTTPDGAPQNYMELNAIFDKVFATKPRDEWMEIFLSHGLLACSVQQIQEVPDDPQALANNFVVPFEHPLQGPVKIPGYPVSFSACEAGTRTAAPRLGEHTDLVMKELGYTDQDIDDLKKAEIIR